MPSPAEPEDPGEIWSPGPSSTPKPDEENNEDAHGFVENPTVEADAGGPASAEP